MNVVALAGGVGGAKFSHGLANVLPTENLTIIVNCGDDFEHLGLKISPDLDTVCYTLAEMDNPVTGWGRLNETWNTMESLAELGGPTWFQLGDFDLGTHLERTRLMKFGYSLSQITKRFCHAWEVGQTVLPVSDGSVPTRVNTDNGELTFQEYFVQRKCQPRVTGFRFEDVVRARPAPGVLESLRDADVIIICPSNPWVSIDPILAIPGVRSELVSRTGGSSRPVVAVSPIMGGEAVKGPAAKMFAELGIQPSALAVAEHYGSCQNDGLLTGFVLDNMDAVQGDEVQAQGLKALVTNTLMNTPDDRRRLASEVLEFSASLKSL